MLIKVAHDLVDDIVVTEINHAGYHDLKGVNRAAFLRQIELCSGPEANWHVAAGVQTIHGVGSESE
jgi:hypothetical protein